MLDNKINVCLACDDNYARYAGVVIASILKSSDNDDQLSFYILDGGITGSNKNLLLSLKSIKECEINFIEIKEELFDDYKKVKTHSYITLATYYRLKLPTLLPNVERVIYFDCDFVVTSSLKELFNADLEGHPIAGVHDIKQKAVEKNPTYVNAGMLVLDINKIRDLGLEQKFLEWTKANIATITCGDQEIINEVCKGDIQILEDSWNVQSSNFTNRSSYTKHPKCIHFVAKKKPWHFASYSYHRKLYFKFLQYTPWALNKKNLFYWTTFNQLASILSYIKYRPFFMFRPKFYKALYYTYIRPMYKGDY